MTAKGLTATVDGVVNKPIIVLGMNRSGTKIASYLIARSFQLKRVCLEPFYWEGGVDMALGDDWAEQLRQRRPSKPGHEEHRRLPVWCAGPSGSPWLEQVLKHAGWDVVKLVEIGRAGLYRAICPNAYVIGLIRHPVGNLESLAGSNVQKAYVADQWRRLKQEQGFVDPLPDATRWMPEDVADCARYYAAMYRMLGEQREWFNLRMAYEGISNSSELLNDIGATLGRGPVVPVNLPRFGHSTRQPMSDDARQYVEQHLLPAYEFFLR
jgi:hypothetical protein